VTDAEEPVVDAHPRQPAVPVTAPESNAYGLRDWAWAPVVWEDGRELAVFPVAGTGPHRDVRVWETRDGRRCVYDRHRGQYTPLAAWAAVTDAGLDSVLRLHVVTFALQAADSIAAAGR
jgi:hypothetical protein